MKDEFALGTAVKVIEEFGANIVPAGDCSNRAAPTAPVASVNCGVNAAVTLMSATIVKVQTGFVLRAQAPDPRGENRVAWDLNLAPAAAKSSRQVYWPGGSL